MNKTFVNMYLKFYKSKIFRRLLVIGLITSVLSIVLMGYTCSLDRCCLELPEVITCHYNITIGDLPPFENTMTSDVCKSGDNAIIWYHRADLMMESGTGWWNSLIDTNNPFVFGLACTVESAARAHPNWTIFVLFTGPVSVKSVKDRDNVVSIIKYPNVKYRRVYIEHYVRNTPFELLIWTGALGRSNYRSSHTSDILRFTTLFKHPGVYLDLDIIVSKQLDGLGRNFVIRESDTAVAAGALAFGDDDLGRLFAKTVAEEVSATFDGSDFGYNGPGAMTRVLQRWCTTPRLTDMDAATCKGMPVYSPKIAYPVHWQNAKVYFESGRLSTLLKSHAYMYHVWGRLSRCYTPEEGSPYHELARNYCPDVYKTFRSEFGWKMT